MIKSNKQVALGTALWGWKISRKECFELLDEFYQNQGRYVDTASNYPINGNINDRYAAENILAEWIEINNPEDFRVIYKIGSIKNTNIPENNLSESYLLREIDRFLKKSSSCELIPMIHWDNNDNLEVINRQISFLLRHEFRGVGFSGLRHPELYKKQLSSTKLNVPIYIEAKSNVFESSIDDYKVLDSFKPRIFSYGIGATGLKIDSKYTNDSSFISVRGASKHSQYLNKKILSDIRGILTENDCLKSIYDIGIYQSEKDNRIYGYIIAPRNIQQLRNIYHTINCINE